MWAQWSVDKHMMGAILGIRQPPRPSWLDPGAHVWDERRGRNGVNLRIEEADESFVSFRVPRHNDGVAVDECVVYSISWAIHSMKPAGAETSRHRQGLPCSRCAESYYDEEPFQDERPCHRCMKADHDDGVAALEMQIRSMKL